MTRTDQFILILSGGLMAGMALFIAWDQRTDHQDQLMEQQEVHPGKRVFQKQGCNACHSIDGSPNTGPTVQGLFGSTQKMQDGSTVQVDGGYLRTSLRYPGQQIVKGYPDNMPSYDHLPEQKVDLLITYLKRISSKRNHGTKP